MKFIRRNGERELRFDDYYGDRLKVTVIGQNTYISVNNSAAVSIPRETFKLITRLTKKELRNEE